MNDSLPLLVLLTALAAGPSNQAAAPVADPAASAPQLLELLDGSSLHGQFLSATEKGLAWQHPAAANPLLFTATNLAWVRLPNFSQLPSPKDATCRIKFQNGDEIIGRLISLSSDQAKLVTWFGDDLAVPRDAIAGLTFLAKDFAVLYEGPTGLHDWTLGRAPNSWQFRDGAFVSTGSGTIGRHFRFPERYSLEFDLSWSGSYSLVFMIHTDVVDRLDYNSNGYIFYLGPGYINLQRAQAGAGIRSVGPSVQTPDPGDKNKLHFEFRADRANSTWTVLIDRLVVHQWKDSQAFPSGGTGLVLATQRSGPPLRLDQIKLSTGDRAADLAALSTNDPPVNVDTVYLINRDRVRGAVRAIQEGIASVEAAQTTLKIPLSRVMQVELHSSLAPPAPASPWQVRAFFAGGGTLAFDLERWDADVLSGSSQNFGKVTFNPRSVREVQFNLSRHRNSSLPETTTADDDPFDE